MADFNVVIRLKSEDKVKMNSELVIFPVYISIAHNGDTRYIKTQFSITEKGLKKRLNRIGEISYEVKDSFILGKCYDMINNYIDRCNHMSIANMTCSELISILKKNSNDISFSEFAKSFVDDMTNSGRERPARNYVSALNSLYEFADNNNLLFTEITSKLLNGWINSLSGTKTAKRAYPSAIKKIFTDGVIYYNDYDREIIQITNDPFKRVKIPRITIPKKRSKSKDDILFLFTHEVKEKAIYNGKEFVSREKQAQDVSMLIFCLAGINVADLYDLRKNNLRKDWKLCYNRKKTRDKRDDNAYIEILVPERIRPLFEKYKGKKYLFDFAERYNTEENFCKYINVGLKKLGTFTTYSLRHSWATIAQNYCGASMADIAFALNHVSGFKITERYVSVDYSSIDKLNNKVINYIFE